MATLSSRDPAFTLFHVFLCKDTYLHRNVTVVNVETADSIVTHPRTPLMGHKYFLHPVNHILLGLRKLDNA